MSPYQPMTREQAHAAGLTDGALRGPRFKQIFRGVHVDARAQIDNVMRARAALLLHPPGAAAHLHTAASLLDLPVPATDVTHVAVFDAGARRQRDTITSWVLRRDTELAVTRGVRVVTGASLFLHLAASLPLRDAVILGDAMVGRRMVTPAELVACCAASSMSGVRRARAAAALVRVGVDSPAETLLRLLLVLAGFPEPEINRTVGRFRIDLCWFLLRLGIEYDGQHHRADRDQWARDIARNEWFDDESWHLIHVISRHLFRQPEVTLQRIHTAYLRCGGEPFTLSDEWRQLFPVSR